MKFLGGRRAADLRPALEHGDFEPGGGEISGGDEAVMAAADDDNVGHQSSGALPQRPLTPSLSRKQERGRGGALDPFSRLREKAARRAG